MPSEHEIKMTSDGYAHHSIVGVSDVAAERLYNIAPKEAFGFNGRITVVLECDDSYRVFGWLTPEEYAVL